MTGPGPAIVRADPSQRETVARLAFGDPSAEAVWMAGNAERARALALALHAVGLLGAETDACWLALDGERPVGVLIGRADSGDFRADWRRLPRVLAAVLRHVPLAELPAFLGRIRLRRRLDLPTPAGAFHVAELRVLPECRGRGVGASLLAAAEAHARTESAPRLSLTTLVDNPARRLFSRVGFAEVDERSHPGYEALTGAPGRVLMVKELSRAPAPPATPR